MTSPTFKAPPATHTYDEVWCDDMEREFDVGLAWDFVRKTKPDPVEVPAAVITQSISLSAINDRTLLNADVSIPGIVVIGKNARDGSRFYRIIDGHHRAEKARLGGRELLFYPIPPEACIMDAKARIKRIKAFERKLK